MSAPRTDREGVTQVLEALEAAGHRPLRIGFAYSTVEEQESVESVAAAIEEVLNLDDAFVIVSNGEREAWVRFVMGNDPDEVVCDYTVSLEPVLGPLTDGWWS